MSLENYRVIDILNNKTILINYGYDHGAAVNDKIRILAKGPEVKDPFTNETLGSLDAIKENLSIVTTYSNFSLCQKIQTVTKSPFVNPLAGFQTTFDEIVSLNVDKESISDKKIPTDKTIRIGDLVEII